MIHDPNFSLDLESHWRRVYPDDSEKYTFIDEERDITIILSARDHRIAVHDLDYFARMRVELQLQAEADAARIFGRPATIYEPIVVPQSWGRAIAYYGHDEGGRQFSYSGSMTCHCTINLYMSTNRLSERELFDAMDGVLSRIVFDRTPLDTAMHLG